MDGVDLQNLMLDEFLRSLSQRGVDVWADEAQLRFRAPMGTLRPEEMAKLREHKAALLQLLVARRKGISIPLVRRGVGERVPVTSMQRRFWQVVIEQGNRSYRECVLPLRITGGLDIVRLRCSIEALVSRHEALRTRIVVTNSLPIQHVDECCRVRLDVVDLTSAADPEGEAKRLARDFLLEAVDLSAGPLFAAQLFRLAPNVSVLVLAFDHLISDAVSMAVCDREIWSNYDGAAEDVPVQLPRPMLQFGDYALWQHRSYDQWLRLNGDYWRAYLRNAPQVRIPYDSPVQVGDDATVATRHFLLGGAGSVRLRSMARNGGVPLNMVVFAIYAAAAAQWLDQRDLTVLFAWSGRDRREIDRTVGFIATALYLRVNVSEAPDLRDLTRVLIRELRSAMAHQDFGRVPDLLPGCHTDLQFNWVSNEWGTSPSAKQARSNASLSVEPFPIGRTRPVKWSAWFVETARGVVARISYRRDQFAESTVNRFGAILQRYAESLE